jgi:hypothetical protein
MDGDSARFAIRRGALDGEPDGFNIGVCAVVGVRCGPAGRQLPGLAWGVM